MDLGQKKQHTTTVDMWLKQTASGLGSDELLRHFEGALDAIQKRILVTLSDVTLHAILVRVLFHGQQKYPLLRELELDLHGVTLKNLRKSVSARNPQEITEAFRFLIIELLAVIESLTGGVLTHPLQKTLLGVSSKKKSGEL